MLPLASADRAGAVVYIGTLSKNPRARAAARVRRRAARRFLARLTALRAIVDRQGDQLVECAVAELIEDGEVQRHARRMRRIYQSRRDALADALHARLAAMPLTFDVPAGGMALWAKVDPASTSTRGPSARSSAAWPSSRRAASPSTASREPPRASASPRSTRARSTRP